MFRSALVDAPPGYVEVRDPDRPGRALCGICTDPMDVTDGPCPVHGPVERRPVLRPVKTRPWSNQSRDEGMVLLARIAFFVIGTGETRQSMVERRFRISPPVAARNLDMLEHNWRVIRRRTERSKRVLLIQTKHARLVADTIAAAAGNPPDTSPPPFAELMIPPLIQQDFRIIRLIAQGCSNAEVGAELFLHVNTVKTHVRRILDACGVRNRAQLVDRAHRLGLLDD